MWGKDSCSRHCFYGWPERGVRVGLVEDRKAVPDVDIDILPIIEASAADLFVIEGEPEGTDEVERRSGGEAEAAGGPGIVRDLRGEEDEVEHLGCGHPEFLKTRSLGTSPVNSENPTRLIDDF